MKNLFFCTGLFFAGMAVMNAQETVEKGRAIGVETVTTANTKVTKIKCDTFFQSETCYTKSTGKTSTGIQKMMIAIYATKSMGEDFYFEGIEQNFHQEKIEGGHYIESTVTYEQI